MAAAKQPIPLDRSREFKRSDYPREPPAYRDHPHFMQRRKEPQRFLTGHIIEQCIREGELSSNEDGLAAFKWRMTEDDGVEYWLLAGFHVDGYRIVVTAWPYLRDRKKALDCGWKPDELDTIAEFNDKTSGQTFSEEWHEYVNWSKSH